MASSEAPPSPDAASTSNEWMLESTVETLGRMMIGCCEFKKTEETSPEEQKPTVSTPKIPAKPREDRPHYSRSRWMPYQLPKRQKTRITKPEVDVKALAKVKWTCDNDIDDLKLWLFDERKSVSCGVQAARPPTPDGEVDELAEYFSHFVRVDMKMSSLAESMYC